MSGGRNQTFDIMKGIGILLMMTCHFFGWQHPVMDDTINSFHMPMFFIVAGYFSKSYADDESTNKSNVNKYFKRLLPAFLLTQTSIALWMLLMYLSGKGTLDFVIINSISVFWADAYGPQTPWGIPSLGVIWFLMALLVAKLLLIPLSRTQMWAIPISLVAGYCAVLLHNVWPYSIWSISLGLTALPFVTIGWWVRRHKIPAWVAVASIASWGGALVYSRLAMYDMCWKCYPLDVLGACGGTYVLYLISKGISKYGGVCGKAMAMLGLWSLAIMCVHCFEIASHLGNHIMGLTGYIFPVWAKYVIRYVVTIGLAIVLYYFPFTKRIFA